MNETLQNALAEILIGAAESVGQAKDFVLSELPDVVQQLLMWKMAESLIQCITGLIVFFVIYKFWPWAIKTCQKDGWAYKNDLEPGVWIGGVFGSGVIGIAGASFINLTWLQIWLAPKAYLIEYAAELVK